MEACGRQFGEWAGISLLGFRFCQVNSENSPCVLTPAGNARTYQEFLIVGRQAPCLYHGCQGVCVGGEGGRGRGVENQTSTMGSAKGAKVGQPPK